MYPTETRRPIYVLWKDDGTATIDLSSELKGIVKVTASVSGNVILSKPNAIEVSNEAIIVEESRKADTSWWHLNITK